MSAEQRLKDELQALSYIYSPEEVSFPLSNSIELTIGDFHVLISIPEGYPETAAPSINIHPQRIDLQKKLSDSLNWQNTECLLDWIEIIKSEVVAYSDTLIKEQPKSKKIPIKTTRADSLSPLPAPPIEGVTITDRKSVFTSFTAKLEHPDQVAGLMQALSVAFPKTQKATHNIFAYRCRIKQQREVIAQDWEDDGEHGAGTRLLHLLQIMDVMDVLVVVSRWYGGIQLGPDRFRHINQCARDALEANGYLGKLRK